VADVDRFKAYNDAFGHPAGDEVLGFAALLAGMSARTTCGPLRRRGVRGLLPGATEAEAAEVAERLRRAAEACPGSRPVTASFGVATRCGAGDDPRRLVERADAALYASKRSGRNRVTRLTGDSAASRPACSE
jgi:diguanylate cyclase (GGDEF)-like protein